MAAGESTELSIIEESDTDEAQVQISPLLSETGETFSVGKWRFAQIVAPKFTEIQNISGMSNMSKKTVFKFCL